MATASDILSRLGGVANVAGTLSISYKTVWSWGDNNFIPEWRWPNIITMAAKMNVPIVEADFPKPDERKRPTDSQAAA